MIVNGSNDDVIVIVCRKHMKNTFAKDEALPGLVLLL